MKKCPKCKKTKEDDHFGVKSNGRLQSWCKQCSSEYTQSIYRKDKKRWMKKSKEQRQLVAKKVYEYLKDHPCEECGENRVACLQFDHIDPQQKVAPVSVLVYNLSWDRVKEEIDKCRVLCANCHLVHTAKQQGWYKYVT